MEGFVRAEVVRLGRRQKWGASARGCSGSADGKSGFAGLRAFYAPPAFADPPSLLN